MLKTIFIESLFDIYTYTLDLQPEAAPFRFITGPNGYGKTTILNILNALYTGDLDTLSAVPFKCLRLTFDDGHEVMVNQRRDYITEEESDERPIANISLHITFTDSKNGSSYIADWDSSEKNNMKENPDLKGLMLYFSSHPIYYIRDGRIRTPEGEPTVKRCVDRMKEMLYENAQSEDSAFNARIEGFRDIIARSEFAHKSMQTDARYGFRFLADNDDHIILPVDKLSSGEQHLLIMTFELLFMASDDSLILIDEPEMSFHMLWQVDYLKNLRSITTLREMQCIVCTHSPQIFNQDWDLTLDLYTLSKANE